MPNADKSHLKLLGSTESFPSEPSAEILETFENHSSKRNYWIKLQSCEFSSLCPVTGQPDYAELKIEYIPDEVCVETKSLKFYLASFRNTKAFNEEIVNRIADDIMSVCSPRRLFVRGAFASRGGISLTVEAEFPDDHLVNP